MNILLIFSFLCSGEMWSTLMVLLKPSWLLASLNQKKVSHVYLHSIFICHSVS